MCLWPGCIYTYTSPDELYSHYRFNHKPFGRNHASREDSLGLSGPHRFIEPPSWNTSPECVSSNWFSETLERWKTWKTSESPVHLSILAANELLLVTSSIGSTVVAIDQGRWLRNLNLHPFWLTFLSLIFLVNATFTLSCSRLLLLILPPPFKDISSMASKITDPAQIPWSRQISAQASTFVRLNHISAHNSNTLLRTLRDTHIQNRYSLSRVQIRCTLLPQRASQGGKNLAEVILLV